MNYQAHYDRLIMRARDRALDGYVERHHILPRCLGGGDEPSNIVRLTAEEHYVAHQLLVRIHPGNGRLVHAAVLMAKRSTGNKAYGWLRKRHAAAVSVTMKGNKSWTGRKHTGEWRAQRSAAQLGTKMPAAGVEKMAASKRGKSLSAEHREKIGAVHRVVRKSQAHKDKIAASHMGIKVPPAARAKIAEANRNRVFTAAMRENMAEGQRKRHRGV